ncbi:MAG: DUF1453 family protein [Burkholderiales bacterium]|nr:DUF1453 family protein [Burkholderiales bacterium]
MQAPGASTITFLVLIPLVIWRVISRVKRLVGRQPLSRVRPWITLTIFPLFILLLAFASRHHLENLSWLPVGLVVGVLLGRFGLRHTRFESTSQGMFYTPNAHLGIALSLLFVLRILYRVVEGTYLHAGTPHNAPDFASSPSTLAVFGLLAGYYVCYAIGLIRWRFAILAEAAAEPALQADAPQIEAS